MRTLPILLLFACAPVDDPSGAREGDDGGECDDGADNDGDRAFDCDDSGCFGAPACEGDDDSAAGDDDSAATNLPPSAPVVSLSPLYPPDAEPIHCLVDEPGIDPEGATVFHRWTWTVNEKPSPLVSSYVPSDLTLPDDQWTCTVTPWDGLLEGPPGSASVVVGGGNQPPSQPVVTIEPLEPVDADDLHCVVLISSVDPEEDPVSYQFAWRREGEDTGIIESVVQSAHTFPDDAWTCLVIPTDGANDGPPGEATVTILP